MDAQILTVFIILAATVAALVFELVRIDVAAILCMLALGWTGVLTPQETLAGFSSNAVVAMIAVLIMGRGIGKTGIMDMFSRAVLVLGTGTLAALAAPVSPKAAVLALMPTFIKAAPLGPGPPAHAPAAPEAALMPRIPVPCAATPNL